MVKKQKIITSDEKQTNEIYREPLERDETGKIIKWRVVSD